MPGFLVVVTFLAGAVLAVAAGFFAVVAAGFFAVVVAGFFANGLRVWAGAAMQTSISARTINVIFGMTIISGFNVYGQTYQKKLPTSVGRGANIIKVL